ncbi:hypothetical protein ACLMAJ_13320 [Nocardia sp. KC 131]
MASVLFGLLLVAVSEHGADIAFQCTVIAGLIADGPAARRCY